MSTGEGHRDEKPLDICQQISSCFPADTALCVAGSMILLLHWSLLNFIAVIKILKKHGELPGPIKIVEFAS